MKTLPAWCAPLLGAQRMRAIDRWAIEERGVPGIELMERAGLAVARYAEELAPDGPVAVLCGGGNNGGDGFVAARALRAAGRTVRVLCTGALDDYDGDARTSLERLDGEPPREHAFAGADGDSRATLAEAALLVDALLGTGFSGRPRSPVADAIDAVNEAGTSVLSVDVPSGVDASSGAIAGSAVRASATATFQFAKPGLWIAPGKGHAGEVRVIDIGIPRGALEATADVEETAAEGGEAGDGEQAAVGLIEGRIARELPRRAAGSTKFSSGHVLVAGGSRGLTGAPTMTAHAAARAGAGYVTALVPAALQDLLVGIAPPEVMTRGLAEEDEGAGAIGSGAVDAVLEAAARGGAIALGNGLGRSAGAVAFARATAARAKVPLVLDADGLNAHAGALEGLASRSAATVLTPHAGELGRLLEITSEEVERERLRHVREAARRARAIVVLKGDDTLVADADGMVAVSAGGSPALATAGTGDVLAGVIAALLASAIDGFTAAAAGVWLHARAGRLAALRLGSPEGVIATDVIAALPAARVPEET